MARSLLNGQTVVTASSVASGTTASVASPTATAQPSGNYPNDTFTRSESNSWGESSSGHTYVLLGDESDFDVTGTAGTMAVDAGEEHKAHVYGVSLLNAEVLVKVVANKVEDEGALMASVNLHCVDLANHYRCAVWFRADGSVDFEISRVIAAQPTRLAIEASTALTAPTTAFWIRAAIEGGVLSMKAWDDGDSEPGSYDLEVEDDTQTLSGASSVGLGTYVESTYDDPPVTFSFDGLATTIPS